MRKTGLFKSFNHILLILSVGLMCLSVTSCGEEHEEEIVITEGDTQNQSFSLVAASMEDVVLTRSVNAVYTQQKEQEISFDSGGRRVSKVYVRSGDTVKKGDILVELAEDNTAEQIDELEYRIQKNKLELSYLDDAEKAEEQSRYNNFVYNDPDIDEDDLKAYQKSIDDLFLTYKYKREDLNDDIEFDNKKLNELRSRLSSSRIVSEMDGVVYKVTDKLEGSTSRKDDVIMVIVDNENGLFETTEPDLIPYFHEGEAVELTIWYSDAKGTYEVVPYDYASWGDTQSFSILSGPDNEGIDVGTSGTIVLVMDERKNVLSLPKGAIYYADGKPYVYILDENSYRQINWVEIGLIGDDRVEITGGLSEGDMVVYG